MSGQAVELELRQSAMGFSDAFAAENRASNLDAHGFSSPTVRPAQFDAIPRHDGGGKKAFRLAACLGNLLGVEPQHHKQINVALLGSCGTILEWFDFAVFGYFADSFSESFFPGADPTLSLIKTFAVFWVAFFFRPIGGILFGAMGDRLGRKPAVLLSIFTMATSTTLMGCLPTYNQVGFLAPVLLVIARSLQGLSVGGQVNFAFKMMKSVFKMMNFPSKSSSL